MQSIRIIVGSVLLVCSAIVASAEGNKPDDNACMNGPMAQFGHYVGDWKIDDETLAQDDNGCDWVMEMSFDEGETWTQVYKIKATPWQEETD